MKTSTSRVVPLDACQVVTVHPDKVALARQKVPDAEEAGVLADLFKLLGEPKRTRILYALLEAGELCVCDTATAPRASTLGAATVAGWLARSP